MVSQMPGDDSPARGLLRRGDVILGVTDVVVASAALLRALKHRRRARGLHGVVPRPPATPSAARRSASALRKCIAPANAAMVPRGLGRAATHGCPRLESGCELKLTIDECV